MISVQLICNPKSPFHNDLFLIIPTKSIRIKADSYYLVIDHTILPDEGSYEKVLLVLKSMLTSWQLLVEGLTQGEEVFLPFDLADQEVGGLYTRLNGDNLGVQYVITTQYQGYHFIASKIKKVTLAESQDPFFWGDETIIPRVQFIEEVEKAKNGVNLSYKLS